MATLDAADVTITIDRQDIAHKTRVVHGTMAIAGTDTYPAAGIPLPAIGVFGFKSYMESLVIYGQTVLTNAYMPFYNKAAHKLQLFVSHDTAGATALPMDEEGADAVGPRTYQFVATGW
jgi:hypothetical protein